MIRLKATDVVKIVDRSHTRKSRGTAAALRAQTSLPYYHQHDVQ